ncbi:MAG: glycerol-3-phosphate 1-O-acyltransferase PlsY [Lachnospiraceae bacterium]
MFARMISLLIGYLFGIIQTAYIYGRINGIDIREHGSGNAGTTNALRVLGKKAGAVVFLGDCFKCVAAAAVVKLIFRNSAEDILPLLGIYAAAGCILGHNFPIQLGFRGGKGIACTAGMFLALDFKMTAVALVSFLLVVAVTRYVSLGSIIVVIEFIAMLVIFGQKGVFGMTQSALTEMYIIGTFLTIMAIFRHRANIVRLINGTENKIFLRNRG